MTRSRAPINLGDDNDEDDIDMGALAKASAPRATPDQASIRRVAQESGFTSRGDKRQRRRRRRSPYTVTCGIRASEDMRVLFQDLAEHLNLKDAEAFELAILELAKAHGTAEHVERHAAILERYLSAD
ncbi:MULTISPECIES: hypothetical protein [Alphaproteobacteria]|jgi:hypothetical protein|uniref:Stability/partitioning determinant n=1 Tax=Maricaulis virginensis TaxID=144022 RepID=A0A9W6IND9_9PROT|nr:hypothetical protein [Maricaulis virginensis]GLK53523.1 hypothetical protein GCM10017621_30310 [Maricaulis virginensis]